MNATYVQRGEYIDYTPTEKINAGDIVIVGKLACISKLDIEAGKIGALSTCGVFDVVKGDDALTAGDRIYWNGTKATTSADNGQTSDAKVDYPAIGVAIADAIAADHTVRILLNAGNCRC